MTDTPTHNANLAGTKIDPLASETTKSNQAQDTHSSIGNTDSINTTHIAPLDSNKASDQGQSATDIATDVATKVKDSVIGVAQNAYDAVVGKK